MTYTTYIADIRIFDTDNGVRVESVLSNGERSLIPWTAPDHATAWKWARPLIGCMVK